MEKLSVELLLEMKARSKHTDGVVAISPELSATEAAQILKEKNLGLLVVLEQGKLVGVISERDIVQRWVSTERFPHPIRVKDIMSKNVEVVTALDTVFDCYLRFVARGCRHLPVVDAVGSVIGVLSLRDVADYVVNELRKS